MSLAAPKAARIVIRPLRLRIGKGPELQPVHSKPRSAKGVVQRNEWADDYRLPIEPSARRPCKPARPPKLLQPCGAEVRRSRGRGRNTDVFQPGTNRDTMRRKY